MKKEFKMTALILSSTMIFACGGTQNPVSLTQAKYNVSVAPICSASPTQVQALDSSSTDDAEVEDNTDTKAPIITKVVLKTVISKSPAPKANDSFNLDSTNLPTIKAPPVAAKPVITPTKKSKLGQLLDKVKNLFKKKK
ncbi:MAG: hypothetical protein H7263_18325 [Candidatus Sericytochromatia bacterium]|nr:hypothetical protein [Candidatus Sericytochromatia bacterium]